VPEQRRFTALLRSQARRLGRSGMVAAAILAFLTLLVIAGPLLTPDDPNAVNLAQAFAGPSSAHLLGTDSLGRDLLSRLIEGARTSLLGALIVVLAAASVGASAAIASAWSGGWLDAIVSRIVDIMFAFPGLLLAILAVALFGPGLTAPIIALAIAYTPGMARVTRSAALRERSLPYVDALQVQGMSGPRICAHHILPNLSRFLIAQITVSFGYAIVDLAAISFLGLGVQPPQSDWGLMVANGESNIFRGYPQESLYAGIMIVIAVSALNVLGNRLGEGGDERRIA
jgi:peptide/nickel transport system permease protein